MPNGKTHFITGAAVGATVNFIIQSATMAMDYDRPFDWDEFFLCVGAGAFAANPKGIASSSPGLRGTSYPGWEDLEFQTLKGFRPWGEFFHSIATAGLIAYAISRDRTVKFSRTTRLFLWAFVMSYLVHITCSSCSLRLSGSTFSTLPATVSNLR